jgi:hypothetical protein
VRHHSGQIQALDANAKSITRWFFKQNPELNFHVSFIKKQFCCLTGTQIPLSTAASLQDSYISTTDMPSPGVVKPSGWIYHWRSRLMLSFQELFDSFCRMPDFLSQTSFH